MTGDTTISNPTATPGEQGAEQGEQSDQEQPASESVVPSTCSSMTIEYQGFQGFTPSELKF
jgi:hypothetical protein